MPFHSSNNLNPGEAILAEVRPYPFAQMGRWLFAAFFLLAPFFFLVLLFQLGRWGILLFILPLFIGAMLTVRLIRIYTRTVLIVTNRRLIDIDQKGLFECVVSEADYDQVQDVSFSVKGMRQTLLGFGNVAIHLAGTQTNLEVHNTHHPGVVHERIQKARAEAQPSAGQTDDTENVHDDAESENLTKTVRRLRQMMGKKDFQKLMERIEDE